MLKLHPMLSVWQPLGMTLQAVAAPQPEHLLSSPCYPRLSFPVPQVERPQFFGCSPEHTGEGMLNTMQSPHNARRQYPYHQPCSTQQLLVALGSELSPPVDDTVSNVICNPVTGCDPCAQGGGCQSTRGWPPGAPPPWSVTWS
jgi:hypothetical protein